MSVVTLGVATAYDLPIRDPDGVAVPMYVQLPIICLIAWLLDVLPRAVLRCRRDLRELPGDFAAVARERWTRSSLVFAVTGLGTWYVCYATFRNLKSYVPFVNGGLYDGTLDRIDRTLWLGHEPATALHALFGNGWAAHVFSVAYVAWIVLIPATLAIALVWTRHQARASWYVTAIALDWVLGVAAYFAVPSLGPAYSRPGMFDGIAHTYSTTLENTLLRDRISVLADPHGTHAVQTIAAFPSLHVGMMMTLCVFVALARMPRWIQRCSWVFLAITIVGTVYLGWHFFADTIAGMVLGAVAAWVAALATGNSVGLRPRLAEGRAYEAPAESARAPLSRSA